MYNYQMWEQRQDRYEEWCVDNNLDAGDDHWEDFDAYEIAVAEDFAADLA